MKLSKRTLTILKIFSSINPHIKFVPGKDQRTISADEGLLVSAELDEEFVGKYSISELSTLIRNYETVENATIEFGEKQITISGDGLDSWATNYGADALIKSPPPGKSLDDSSATRHTKITKAQLETIKKFAEINSLGHIYIGSDGAKFYLAARDKTNPDSTKVMINLGNTNEPAWEEAFTYERFSKILSEDYDVNIIPSTFASFTAPRLKYFIAVER
jgi:hypothetical protein